MCAAVVRFSTQHNQLNEDLPTFTSTELANFKTSVINSMAGVGIATSQILNTEIFVCGCA